MLFLALALLVFFNPSSLYSAETTSICPLLRSISNGAKFLKQSDPARHLKPELVRLEADLKVAGAADFQRAERKIEAWLVKLEEFYNSGSPSIEKLEKIKSQIYQQYVIKEKDIPESYYALQERIAREQGRRMELDASTKKRLADIAIEDQKKSLDVWIDYFASGASAEYPMWAKVWALEGLQKLGKLDKESWKFASRSKDTVGPFAELNPEALAWVMDRIKIKVDNPKNLSELPADEQALLQSPGLGKLYAYALKKLSSADTVAGVWVKYPQGSAPDELVKSLQCQNTGWCTAGEGTARSQLQGGDFHVYYSLDAEGKPSVPRIAIRMEGKSIGEVRGVGQNQNLDATIANSGELEKKLSEFGEEGARYQKRSVHMKRLTFIEKKVNANQELSTEELRFLYEIDEPIKGFGNQKDPRIQELLGKREKRTDIGKIFGVDPSKIS